MPGTDCVPGFVSGFAGVSFFLCPAGSLVLPFSCCVWSAGFAGFCGTLPLPSPDFAGGAAFSGYAWSAGSEDGCTGFAGCAGKRFCSPGFEGAEDGSPALCSDCVCRVLFERADGAKRILKKSMPNPAAATIKISKKSFCLGSFTCGDFFFIQCFIITFYKHTVNEALDKRKAYAY